MWSLTDTHTIIPCALPFWIHSSDPNICDEAVNNISLWKSTSMMLIFLYENSSDTTLSLKNTDIKFYQNVSSGAWFRTVGRDIVPLHAFSSYQGHQTLAQCSESAFQYFSPNGHNVFGVFNNLYPIIKSRVSTVLTEMNPIHRNLRFWQKFKFGFLVALNNSGYQVFPRGKRPGCGVEHPPPFSAEVKERIGLYL